MQRRPIRLLAGAALALTLAGGAAACTGGAGDSDASGAEPGTATGSPSPAASGRYQSLPEPCGAVSRETLKKMLPGAETTEGDGADGAGEATDGTQDTGPSPYEGEAKVTYDTDRRVGCGWQSATGNGSGSRHLDVTFERVVSFDPDVSDDEQATIVFDDRAGEAEIPSAPVPEEEQQAAEGDDTGTGGDTDAEAPQDSAQPSDEPPSDAQPSDEPPGEPTPSASASASASGDGDGEAGQEQADDDAAALAPRPLTGLADDAYLDDALDRASATGGGGTQRDVTVVLRRANVLVTVAYGQSVTDPERTPDSAALQRLAQDLAGELVGRLDEDS